MALTAKDGYSSESFLEHALEATDHMLVLCRRLTVAGVRPLITDYCYIDCALHVRDNELIQLHGFGTPLRITLLICLLIVPIL